MCPSAVVILLVRAQHMTQMPLAEHDHMVEALASDGADQSFSVTVLPRRSWRCRSVANAHRANAARICLAVDTVAITRLDRPAGQRGLRVGAGAGLPRSGVVTSSIKSLLRWQGFLSSQSSKPPARNRIQSERQRLHSSAPTASGLNSDKFSQQVW